MIRPEVFVARPALWLRAMSRYRALISPAPNFAYSLCVQRMRDAEIDGVDLSSWRMALNGAEQAVPDVLRAFSRRFARWGFAERALTPVYGLSEAALAVTFGEIDRAFFSLRFDRELLSCAGLARESADGREIVSVGRPIPGMAVRVAGPDGEALPERSVGVIECRGPSLMEGYLGQPDVTAEVLRNGWLNTGDLGFTCCGDLFITGRAKDVLLVRGRNYAPEEVEHAAETAAGVRAGCVVAATWLPDGAETERLLVLAEARRDLPSARYRRDGRLDLGRHSRRGRPSGGSRRRPAARNAAEDVVRQAAPAGSVAAVPVRRARSAATRHASAARRRCRAVLPGALAQLTFELGASLQPSGGPPWSPAVDPTW